MLWSFQRYKQVSINIP
jgi:NAD(P)-dependent dehydrogenase (short-subunit alcohol dehydrogenase family)